MVLTKDHAIHVVSLLLAFPTLWILERLSPSRRCQLASALDPANLMKALSVSVGLIIFFTPAHFSTWPDFHRDPGTVGHWRGLWEAFTI